MTVCARQAILSTSVDKRSMRVRHPPPGRRVVPRECPGQYRAERYPLIVRIPLLAARGLHEDRAGCPSDRYPIVRDLSDPAEKLTTVDKAEADLRRVVHAAGKKGLHPRDIGHRPSIKQRSSRGCRRGPQPSPAQSCRPATGTPPATCARTSAGPTPLRSPPRSQERRISAGGDAYPRWL